MQAATPTVVKVNNVNVNILSVDTGAYPDVNVGEIVSYNHLTNPSAQGMTLRAGLNGRVSLLSNGLPAIPVALFGKRVVTAGSAVLYKLTVFTKEQDFFASVSNGTVTATSDGLIVQMPNTPGIVTLTLNNYKYQIDVQAATNTSFIADDVITPLNLVPIPENTSGAGNNVVISKDGNWLATVINGFDVDGVTLLAKLAIFIKVQNGNKYDWQLNALLDPASPDSNPELFGVIAIDINADGSLVVVGDSISNITEEGLPVIEKAGDITVYKRSGLVWDTGSRFYLPDPYKGSFFGFGHTVAMSNDGTRIVVGQPDLTNQTTTQPINTRTFIIDFDPINKTFTIIKALKNSPTNSKGARRGINVAICETSGGYQYVFSTNYYIDEAGFGVASIEEFPLIDNTFLSQPSRTIFWDSVLHPDPNTLSFGAAGIEISDDGNTLVVAFSVANDMTGLVQVFKRDENFIWVKHSELVSPFGQNPYALFGNAIAITPNADFIFVGETELQEDNTNGGVLHIFKYNPVTDTYLPLDYFRCENNIENADFATSIAYDRSNRYLAVNQEGDGGLTINGSIYYIPVNSVVV